MHFCTAHVAIGGDPRNIMYRDEFSPVSWPEVDVLREIHGGEAVTEIRPFADVPQAARAEWNRLMMKYGEEILAKRWGGKNPPSELKAAGVKPRPDIVWMNPLSGLTEKTTADGSEPYTIPSETRPIAEVVGNYAIREEEVRAAKPAAPTSEMYRDDPEDEILFEPDLPPVVEKKAAKK